MARYKRFLIIIPTAATIAALNTLSAFSASAQEIEMSGKNTPIVMSSVGTKQLNNERAIEEEMVNNFGPEEVSQINGN